MVSAQNGQGFVGASIGTVLALVACLGVRSAWQCGHFVASSWIFLRQAGHCLSLPAANEKASPNGPNRIPSPNHRQPFAPLLEAINAAAMPQIIQMRMAISISSSAKNTAKPE